MEKWQRVIGLTFDQPIQSVLCVGAHADDIEIGAAGLVRHLADRYDPEFAFVVLSGDEVRCVEAEESMASLIGERGELRMRFSTDNLLPYEDPVGVKEFLRAAVRAYSPQIVIAPRDEDLHQDHSFAARLVQQICRDHLVLAYEIVKYDGDLGRPQAFLPLSAKEADAKTNHLVRHFESQRDKLWYNPESFRALMHLRGVECNSVSGLAEAFYVSKLRLA